MKILVAHNHYGDHALGGEAMVFNAESKLLSSSGYEVLKYEKSNSEIDRNNFLQKLKKVKNIHWSEDTITEVESIMDNFQPDVLHVHNYKYIITPSIFQAARNKGVKTVLTLHNYRLMVPCGNFMTKEGAVCEKCVFGYPEQILLKRCAQGSMTKSFLQYRLFKKTKNDLSQLIGLVDRYVVLSEFAKQKLVQAGIHKEKIFVKPNFVIDSAETSQIPKHERAVFIGRLSFEKGILQLIERWKKIDYPLFIIGSGPLFNEVQNAAAKNPNIKLLGGLSNAESIKFLRGSAFMVFPSTWYEGMGLTILEAMSVSLPVIASRLGPRSEVVNHNVTGFLYEVDDSVQFASQVNELIINKDLRSKLGSNAREMYLIRYTPEVNINLMNNLYSELFC